jgi:hypothetical protein
MERVIERKKEKEVNEFLTRNLDSKVLVDVERLKASMKTETIIAPVGMSREDRRKFILSFANK